MHADACVVLNENATTGYSNVSVRASTHEQWRTAARVCTVHTSATATRAAAAAAAAASAAASAAATATTAATAATAAAAAASPLPPPPSPSPSPPLPTAATAAWLPDTPARPQSGPSHRSNRSSCEAVEGTYEVAGPRVSKERAPADQPACWCWVMCVRERREWIWAAHVKSCAPSAVRCGVQTISPGPLRVGDITATHTTYARSTIA